MNRLPVAVLVVVLAAVSCERVPGGSRPGEVYRRIARPEVWHVLPSGQAERLGLEPGDLILSYNSEPVAGNADIIAAQERAAGAVDSIPIIVLRAGRELEFRVAPGTMGVLPVASRYPSSLAIALEDIMGGLGLFADYDWLAALTGESFALAANEDGCRAWWPGEASGSYLEDVALMAGLELLPILPPDREEDMGTAIRNALDQGRAVLVRGGWPGYRADFWGRATRFDPELGEMGVLLGHTLDSAEELPLAGPVAEAYIVEPGIGWDDLGEVLALVLTQALELGLARTEYGPVTGLQAWDRLIIALDTVPFCPGCGLAESPVCFERLLWALIAHKESAIRMLGEMSTIAPDQAGLFDEITGDLQAQVGKLEGIARSGARIGELESQRRIARALAEVQLIENDLLGLYEELLGRL